jgi:hypothetical protein
VALQYNELEIWVTLRPIQEMFQIRDVYDPSNNYPYIQPDFNRQELRMYRFLQTPPSIFMDAANYTNQSPTWNADVHLLCNYCFLSKSETELFAAKDQVYLVKDVFYYTFENVTGTSKVQLTSNGMITNWMWYLQRNDVNMRNEWSNYSNWPYAALPANIVPATAYLPPKYVSQAAAMGITQGPYYEPNGKLSGLFETGDFIVDNQKEILLTAGILFNGEYRENTLPSGVFNYVEKYTRTQSSAKEGLYCYNFCLNTSPFEYQPSGAINMSKFKTVELEISTYVPPFPPKTAIIRLYVTGLVIRLGSTSKIGDCLTTTTIWWLWRSDTMYSLSLGVIVGCCTHVKLLRRSLTTKIVRPELFTPGKTMREGASGSEPRRGFNLVRLCRTEGNRRFPGILFYGIVYLTLYIILWEKHHGK